MIRFQEWRQPCGARHRYEDAEQEANQSNASGHLDLPPRGG
jgi:hypothetical protein